MLTQNSKHYLAPNLLFFLKTVHYCLVHISLLATEEIETNTPILIIFRVQLIIIYGPTTLSKIPNTLIERSRYYKTLTKILIEQPQHNIIKHSNRTTTSIAETGTYTTKHSNRTYTINIKIYNTLIEQPYQNTRVKKYLTTVFLFLQYKLKH